MRLLKVFLDFLELVQGAIYLTKKVNEEIFLSMKACYAYNRKKYLNQSIKLGDGLVGEAAIEQQFVHRTEIPDDYLTMSSGLLSDKKPDALLIMPLISEDQLQGAIELIGLKRF